MIHIEENEVYYTPKCLFIILQAMRCLGLRSDCQWADTAALLISNSAGEPRHSAPVSLAPTFSGYTLVVRVGTHSHRFVNIPNVTSSVVPAASGEAILRSTQPALLTGVTLLSVL